MAKEEYKLKLDGKEYIYDSWYDIPPEHRKYFDDKNQNMVPDFIEQAMDEEIKDDADLSDMLQWGDKNIQSKKSSTQVDTNKSIDINTEKFRDFGKYIQMNDPWNMNTQIWDEDNKFKTLIIILLVILGLLIIYIIYSEFMS